MQINNSTSPNFKGIYIIKGPAYKVEKASNMIRRACNNQSVHDLLAFEAEMEGRTYEYPKQVLKNFTDCMYCYLTNVYDKLQPLVQNLIATNEDTEIITEYLGDYLEISDEAEADNYSIDEVKGFISKIINEHEENMVAYQEAKEKCYNGDSSALANIVVKSQIESKEKLNEILEPYGIAQEEIPVISADKAIECMENNLFHYETGRVFDETYGIDS